VLTIQTADGRKQQATYTGANSVQEADHMNKRIGKIVDLAFKALALAMGIAVVVTTIMGVMDMKGQILLLGIGLFCLAFTAFDKE
jgi:energy-converting hydrogenase Eha subunit A